SSSRTVPVSWFLRASTSRTSRCAAARLAVATNATVNPSIRIMVSTWARVRKSRAPRMNDGRLHVDSSRTVAEFVGWDAGLVEQRDHQIRERRLQLGMTITLELSRGSADEQNRQVLMGVLVAVAHPASIQEHRVIEQASVTVGRRSQALE